MSLMNCICLHNITIYYILYIYIYYIYIYVQLYSNITIYYIYILNCTINPAKVIKLEFGSLNIDGEMPTSR